MPRPQSESVGSFDLFFCFLFFISAWFFTLFLYFFFGHIYTPWRQVGYGHGSYEDSDSRSFGNGPWRTGLTKRVPSEWVGLYDYMASRGKGELEHTTKNLRTYG
jgi:hypothetical protein